MYNLDLEKINVSLLKALRLTIAAKKMMGKREPEMDALRTIEGEIRRSAAECQRVLRLVAIDKGRGLVFQPSES